MKAATKHGSRATCCLSSLTRNVSQNLAEKHYDKCVMDVAKMAGVSRKGYWCVNTPTCRSPMWRSVSIFQVERDRGITVKAQTASMLHDGHLLNLIDTPGHVDFSYEVDDDSFPPSCCFLLLGREQTALVAASCCLVIIFPAAPLLTGGKQNSGHCVPHA